MDYRTTPTLRCSLGVMLALTLTIQLFLPAAALSQTDLGRITGTVHDQAKALVPGAKVTAKNDQTGEQRTAITNDEGSFLLTNLKPSMYTIRVSAQGFSEGELARVQVLVGQAMSLDLEVKPAGTTETIDIAAGDEAGLDTTSARIGANVNPREVQGLPLNGRQLSQLYLQAPGSLNSGSGTFGRYSFQWARRRAECSSLRWR